MYSRCHLIAGRFSRVRYRSATESTQSAGVLAPILPSRSPISLSLARASFVFVLVPFLSLTPLSTSLPSPPPRHLPLFTLLPPFFLLLVVVVVFLYSPRCRATSTSSGWWLPGGRREARKKESEHRSGRHRPTALVRGRSLASSSFHGSSPARRFGVARREREVTLSGRHAARISRIRWTHARTRKSRAPLQIGHGAKISSFFSHPFFFNLHSDPLFRKRLVS